MEKSLDTKQHLDPCLIIAGDAGMRAKYKEILDTLGYASIEADTIPRAHRVINRPLLAAIVVDWFSPFGEDMLGFVRMMHRPRAPIIVLQSARYDEVARSGPDYIVHWDDKAQLRLTLEEIERTLRTLPVKELHEPGFATAAE